MYMEIISCSGTRLGKRKTLHLFMPTVPKFAVRETDVSRHNGGNSGAPLKPLRDDSALRALSPIMPRNAVSRTANVERTSRHKWDNGVK